MSSNQPWPPRWLSSVSPEDQNRGDGDLYASFAEAVCRVTKDSVASPAGKLLILRPWQKELLRHALAKREDGRFLHRTALVGMARKNGKSALAASMGLAGLTLGGQGSEIYSCAAEGSASSCRNIGRWSPGTCRTPGGDNQTQI